MDSWLPILYVLGLACAYMCGAVVLRTAAAPASGSPPAPRFPIATVLLLLAVGLPSALQFVFPALLPALQRDGARIAQGEWWRLITALGVQDGGLGGAVFNLVSLLLIGLVAERLLGAGRVALLFFLGGIVAEVVALAWQPLGAGNSVGNFSLAAGMAVFCLRRRPAPRAARIAALLAFAAYIMLAGLRDIHGAAALAGAVLALVLG
jgi:membrane associated rhomboid family serine protease